jgi:hypothetical protein
MFSGTDVKNDSNAESSAQVSEWSETWAQQCDAVGLTGLLADLAELG